MRRLKAPLGPAVLDPIGTALTEDDRRRMLHPAAGGVILFSRNFESARQLQALTEEIRALPDTFPGDREFFERVLPQVK